jgi:AAA domain
VPSSTRKQCFPVLLHFTVSGYQLFPGQNNQGIDYTVQAGVTVIAGINGLGKTTLLNMLFRALSGPVDWKSRIPDRPAGGTPTSLGDWKTPDYFQSRVTDAASLATITVEVAFGSRHLKVTRSLADLSVKSLQVDGEQYASTQDAYIDAVCELSGFASFPDFFLVLRYLVFLLEDRQEVVWDPGAQADVLRALFFDAAAAAKYRTLFDGIQKKDSDRRNRRAQYNRHKSDLDALQAKEGGDPIIPKTLQALEVRLQALSERQRALERALERADRARRRQRLLVEQAKLTHLEAWQAYESLERAHLAALFPTLDEVANRVLVQAATGGGCLVCGSRTDRVAREVRASISKGLCPVCSSTVSEQEADATVRRPSHHSLLKADSDVQDAVKALAERQTALRQSVAEYEESAKQCELASLEEEAAILDLDKLRKKLPASAKDLGRRKAEIARDQVDLDRLKKEQASLEKEFKQLITNGEQRVEALSARITDRFAHFAGHFLAEQVRLVYDPDERRIGQEGSSFRFPRFSVQLTSAAAPDTMTARQSAYEVSESQKEFIDLSFRMALVEVAAAGGPAMLVLETPEASLDSLFVARAGQLLGHFASGGAGVGNRLIASSNLTKGEMISALLGALPSSAKGAGAPYTIPRAQRRLRVVNLLALAQENAALKGHRRQYEAELARSIEGFTARRKSAS